MYLLVKYKSIKLSITNILKLNRWSISLITERNYDQNLSNEKERGIMYKETHVFKTITWMTDKRKSSV